MKLLYIDDDAGLRRLVERGLVREGISVDTAADGEAGLTALATTRYDIVALDHYMPGLDGLQTLARIQALPSPPPVIVVTGAQESRIAVAALKAGASDYVIKDVDSDFLTLLLAAANNAVNAATMRHAKEAAEAEIRDARDRFEKLAAEREMLLREVNHRVGNSLQLIAAFLELQAGGTANAGIKAALTDETRRVVAVAQVHKRLYTSEDVKAVSIDQYLATLVDDLAHAAQGPNHITLSAEPLEVDPDRAVAIGVIVNELVMNAFKYAYPGGNGQIRVRLSLDGTTRVDLSVEDDGVGYDRNSMPHSTGLGRSIVAAMASKLKANLTHDDAHRGTRVVVSFPS